MPEAMLLNFSKCDTDECLVPHARGPDTCITHPQPGHPIPQITHLTPRIQPIFPIASTYAEPLYTINILFSTGRPNRFFGLQTEARVSAGHGARRGGDGGAGRGGPGADMAGALLLDEDGGCGEAVCELDHQPHCQRNVRYIP